MKEILLFLLLNFLIESNSFTITLGREQSGREKLSKSLPRFWTSTGFCPIGNNVTEILNSYDTKTNIQLIGTIPNHGLKYIRIHWLLDLVENDDKEYNYKELDDFISFLLKNGVFPHFELMSHRKFDWEKISFEVIDHYSKFYGTKVVGNWRFETWNEPDLKMYNVLNFTATGS